MARTKKKARGAKAAAASSAEAVPSGQQAGPRSVEKAEVKGGPLKGKAAPEIDAIFAAQKAKKKESKESENNDDSGAKGPKVVGDLGSGKAKKGKKRKSGEDEGEGNAPGNPETSGQVRRRKTNDGLNVYSAEELGWNKKEAGGTPQCPFDCECCF